jgi:hypothetical protein
MNESEIKLMIEEMEKVNSFSDLCHIVYKIPSNDILYQLLDTAIDKTRRLIQKEMY